MKISLSYDHWSLRKWRIKIGKVMDFLREKSFFLRKYFDVPHAIGVLGRTFEPITPELSQRCRLLGAVAQWQLRLCFFFADFVTCANFSNLCGKFLTTHNRYGHHVSAKSCAGSWATFSSKKKFGKNSASWFFQKEVFMFDPLFLRTETEYNVHAFVHCTSVL